MPPKSIHSADNSRGDTFCGNRVRRHATENSMDQSLQERERAHFLKAAALHAKGELTPNQSVAGRDQCAVPR